MGGRSTSSLSRGCSWNSSRSRSMSFLSASEGLRSPNTRLRNGTTHPGAIVPGSLQTCLAPKLGRRPASAHYALSKPSNRMSGATRRNRSLRLCLPFRRAVYHRVVQINVNRPPVALLPIEVCWYSHPYLLAECDVSCRNETREDRVHRPYPEPEHPETIRCSGLGRVKTIAGPPQSERSGGKRETCRRACRSERRRGGIP